MADLADIPAGELCERWLRALTVLAEPGDRPLAERMDLIAQVNPARRITLPLTGPLSDADFDALTAALSDLDKLRGRETGLHAQVTVLLVRWLSEATGVTPEEVITRLALAIERVTIESLNP